MLTRTIQRALRQRDWYRYVAYQQSFINKKLAERRVEEARKSLKYQPYKED